MTLKIITKFIWCKMYIILSYFIVMLLVDTKADKIPYGIFRDQRQLMHHSLDGFYFKNIQKRNVTHANITKKVEEMTDPVKITLQTPSFKVKKVYTPNDAIWRRTKLKDIIEGPTYWSRFNANLKKRASPSNIEFDYLENRNSRCENNLCSRLRHQISTIEKSPLTNNTRTIYIQPTMDYNKNKFNYIASQAKTYVDIPFSLTNIEHISNKNVYTTPYLKELKYPEWWTKVREALKDNQTMGERSTYILQKKYTPSNIAFNYLDGRYGNAKKVIPSEPGPESYHQATGDIKLKMYSDSPLLSLHINNPVDFDFTTPQINTDDNLPFVNVKHITSMSSQTKNTEVTQNIKEIQYPHWWTTSKGPYHVKETVSDVKPMFTTKFNNVKFHTTSKFKGKEFVPKDLNYNLFDTGDPYTLNNIKKRPRKKKKNKHRFVLRFITRTNLKNENEFEENTNCSTYQPSDEFIRSTKRFMMFITKGELKDVETFDKISTIVLPDHTYRRNIKHYRLPFITKIDSKDYKADDKFNQRKISLHTSRAVSWSEYPYAAVYIYEPMQVRCDAASISAHWLIAAASCLSRHQNDPFMISSLAAYVTYCGANWQQQTQVAYVRQTVMHPKYNHQIKTIQYMYNIGAIQTVQSMASNCINWRPATLASYQLFAYHSGMLAKAVGWGFDSIENQDLHSQNPTKSSLTEYLGKIYIDSCPGNSDYSEIMEGNRKGVRNVICLSLPPYTDETHDAVHGGLLVVEGKLTALYLQEERRATGPQSAEYTGIWSLLPWIYDVALELEDATTEGSPIILY